MTHPRSPLVPCDMRRAGHPPGHLIWKRDDAPQAPQTRQRPAPVPHHRNPPRDAPQATTGPWGPFSGAARIPRPCPVGCCLPNGPDGPVIAGDGPVIAGDGPVTAGDGPGSPLERGR
jgi:hypothetical protein